MTVIPPVVPPLPRSVNLDRELPREAAFDWLRKGWSDTTEHNLPASIFFGLLVFVVSIVIVTVLFITGADYAVFPALAGFMIVGPALAGSLYTKSRLIEEGEPVKLSTMLLTRPKSRGQILFVGVLLCLLIVTWLRVAVMLYALFFGVREFDGMDHILGQLLNTASGWGLLLVGTLFGGLFAAFAFAISVVSIPMLLNERRDAFTAMGTSMALVWNNLPVMLTWGAIVLASFIACLLTGLVGLLIIYPVLGHGTWHAYRALQGPTEQPVVVWGSADPTESVAG